MLFTRAAGAGIVAADLWASAAQRRHLCMVTVAAVLVVDMAVMTVVMCVVLPWGRGRRSLGCGLGHFKLCRFAM
jgi:hypothetical protein